MTSFLRHEYPDMPVMSEPCRYFMPSAHDNVGDYGNSLDQCRYYGMITRSHNVRSLAPTDSCIIVLRTFPGKSTFPERRFPEWLCHCDVVVCRGGITNAATTNHYVSVTEPFQETSFRES